MNSFIPYRYNQKTNEFEPEVYVSFADRIFLAPDSQETVLSALEEFASKFQVFQEQVVTLVEEGVSNTLIIQSSQPAGNPKQLWINDESVIHYWDGTAWKPVAGTAV